MRDHSKLRAFELADELAIMIYQVTRVFPKEERRFRRLPISSKDVQEKARLNMFGFLRLLLDRYGKCIISSVLLNACDI